ncbi:MAG: hypothetical protein H6Q87_1941 [candidate division NC10 bacterium]|nr:hypothetical protein [candidate division NC10 bacterium]
MTLGHYQILEELGAGRPAFARTSVSLRELRRGFAEAQPRTSP